MDSRASGSPDYAVLGEDEYFVKLLARGTSGKKGGVTRDSESLEASRVLQ